MTALSAPPGPRRAPDNGTAAVFPELPLDGPVLVQGPGGTGKTVLLAALARRYRAAGVAVADARSTPSPDDVEGELAVLVDDAHRLTAADAERLGALVDVAGVRMAVAYRPWPRPGALQELLERLRTGEVPAHPVVLGHAGRRQVAHWADEQLGGIATPGLVDFVLRQTGGLPALVHPLLRSIAAARAGAVRTLRSPEQPVRLEVPPEVVHLVAGGLAALGDDARALLHALAAGAPLDVDVLAEVLGLPFRAAGDQLSGIRSGGFLLASGEVIPLVRSRILAEEPPESTRSLRRRLLGLMLERGDQPVELARALVADGVRDLRAGRVLEDEGTAALAVDPVLAAELLDEASQAGVPASTLHARRAEAAALGGDHDTALAHADAAMGDPAAPDRERAAAVAAAVLAQRGFLDESVRLYRGAGPDHAGELALVLLATGDQDAAEAALTASVGVATGLPALRAGAVALAAQGALVSLGAGSVEDVLTGALSTLARSITLLEPVGRTTLVPDTPAALAALVALHTGELTMAESVLDRALATGLGGRSARPRHLLLQGWTAMLRNRRSAARAHVAEARAAAEHGLAPRDELFLRALEMGIARRDSDLTGLRASWEPAREALLRHPVDLFSLLPLGELVVGAAKLGVVEQLGPYRSSAAALLGRLGNPHVWTTCLHWSGLQAAILAGDPAGLGPCASALVGAARSSRLASALACAGRSWLRVLNGDVDVTDVIAATERLAGVGLTWDGSRLAAQAAARTEVPRDRSTLLQCARSLAGEEPGGSSAAGSSAPAETSAACQLSQREREVAELIVAGQTYREVGGRLFISAKTVEHHVARIRQRLGASTRSDLMSRLRAELAEGA